MTSFTDLRMGLLRLGLSHTAVIAHASLSAFGEVVGGAETLLRATLDSVWALVMPTFSFKTMLTPEVGPPGNAIEYGSGKDLNLMAEFFRQDMPADRLMGAVAEALRKHPRTTRSSHDKSAPSRAFAKLSEALLRVGRDIHPGETCVDVGAAPGSWTWYAINRGARVIAVDRSPLRDDLMRHRQVHVQTADAFRFAPPKPVDWLLCDVIAPPRKSADLLFSWLKRGSCRNFVVTLKLQDEPGTNVIAQLKRQLPPLTRELLLKRLCANKKEVSVVGTTARGQDSLSSSTT